MTVAEQDFLNRVPAILRGIESEQKDIKESIDKLTEAVTYLAEVIKNK